VNRSIVTSSFPLAFAHCSLKYPPLATQLLQRLSTALLWRELPLVNFSYSSLLLGQLFSGKPFCTLQSCPALACPNFKGSLQLGLLLDLLGLFYLPGQLLLDLSQLEKGVSYYNSKVLHCLDYVFFLNKNINCHLREISILFIICPKK
jgi:hypothetical protein